MGLVTAKQGVPTVLGASPVIWLIIGGLVVLYCFWSWATRLEAREVSRCSAVYAWQSPIDRRTDNVLFFLCGGAQHLLRDSAFPSRSWLEMNAISTGLRLVPSVVVAFIASAAIPRFFPKLRLAGWSAWESRALRRVR